MIGCCCEGDPSLLPSSLLDAFATAAGRYYSLFPFIFFKKKLKILIGRIRMTFDVERTPGRLAKWLKQRPDEHDVKAIFCLLPDHHQTAFISIFFFIGSLRFS
jgi:hypothetical protein